MRIPRRLVLAAGPLTLAACQSPTARPTNPAASQAQVDFVTDAYQVIRFDREQGAIAETEARDPRVRAIAQRLVQQANDYAETLFPLAARNGIEPPEVLRYDLRVRLGHMRLQRGLDFDRTYVADQIASHEEALRSAEELERSGGLDPQFAALLRHGKELVQANLTALRELQRDLGPPAS
ncbi:MAG: DUF4142 domain-containing protein [Paracraurococcus sp.]|jgi:predicted outer membrane protein